MKKNGKLKIIALIVVIATLAVGAYFVISNVIAKQSSDLSGATSDISVISDSSADSDPADGDSSADTSNSQTKKQLDEEEKKSNHQITVCVDAGHGGKDPGCLDGDRYEKNDTLELALAISTELKARGVKVIMTRDDDTYIDLHERCAYANDHDADYFLSIHRNTAGGVADGVEVWRSHNADDEAISYAENVMDAIVEVGCSRDRGVCVGSQSSTSYDYLVLRETNMPSIIVEMGFIEDADDNYYFDKYLYDYAYSISDAVIKTYNEYHSDKDEDDADTSAESSADASDVSEDYDEA